MSRITFKHKKTIIPAMLIFLSFLILTLKSSVFLPYLSPFQRALVSAGSWLDRFKEGFSAEREREALLKEIHYLRAKITELEEERLENERLRRLLAFKERETLEGLLAAGVGAKIIGRELTNWYRIVTIDKGKNEGIRKGMPVVTAEGIVGCISQVGGDASQVRLILDGTTSVGGMVQRSRARGVVKGRGANLCEMVYLPPEADIKEDDLIISSGLGGIYPSGLRIGKVISVQVESEGYLKGAEILPAVDFSRLEEVLVLNFQ